MATDAQTKPAEHRRQFSLAALMLLVSCVAVFCAAIKWLGSVWIVPVLLTALSGTSLWLAFRVSSSWRTLKLSFWHLVIWFALGAAASALAVYGCQNYNLVAGTDKTHEHIIQISAATLAGPLVGPVANSAAGETPQAARATAILFTILVLTVTPFLIVRRPVPLAVFLFCWLSFLAALVLWFFGAMVSLCVFLS